MWPIYTITKESLDEYKTIGMDIEANYKTNKVQKIMLILGSSDDWLHIH